MGRNRTIFDKRLGVFFSTTNIDFFNFDVCVNFFSMSICESKFFNVNVSANDAKRTAGGRVQAAICWAHASVT